MLCGIFVGGRASRMHGRAKGLLRADTGEPVVVRLVRVARAAGLEPVWVGLEQSAHADAYRAAAALPELADRPPGIGPLGGLAGLLEAGSAIAVACDMPFVSSALLTRLRSERPGAAVLAPRSQGLWEPLCARYDAALVLPTLTRALDAGTRSFQQLLASLEVTELTLATREELVDWDTPEDLP